MEVVGVRRSHIRQCTVYSGHNTNGIATGTLASFCDVVTMSKLSLYVRRRFARANAPLEALVEHLLAVTLHYVLVTERFPSSTNTVQQGQHL